MTKQMAITVISLLLLTLLAFSPLSLAVQEPQQKQEQQQNDLAKHLRSFHLLYPSLPHSLQTPSEKRGDFSLHYLHANEIAIAINAEDSDGIDSDWTLQLRKNEALFHPAYAEYFFDEKGKIANVRKGGEECHYLGHIVGKEEISLVAASTCAGRLVAYIRFLSSRESRGKAEGEKGEKAEIVEEEYFIEPHWDEEFLRRNANTHIIYRASDMINVEEKTCGVKTSADENFVIGKYNDNDNNGKERERERRRDVTPPSPLYVELGLGNDVTRYKQMGSMTFSSSASYVNIATTRYLLSPNMLTTINVTLKNQMVFQVNDTFLPPNDQGETNPTTLLSDWSSWSATYFSDNDVRQLISGKQFQGTVVGLGWVSSACQLEYSAGIVEALSTTAFISSTMSHELGHNLGMQHDGSSYGNNCDDTSFVMAAVMSPTATPTTFSTCSYSYFETFWNSGSPPTCLENVPTSFWQPYCGDGMVEAPEECDCGANCASDTCCDGATCKFQPGALCDLLDGCCTSSCQPRASGYVCRSSTGECDPQEICDGVSGFCPQNFVFGPAQSCTTPTYSQEGRCLKGTCIEVQSQCEVYSSSSQTFEYCSSDGENSRKCSEIKCNIKGSSSSCVKLEFADGGGVVPYNDGTMCREKNGLLATCATISDTTLSVSVCGSITGCQDIDAINYDTNADISWNTCQYNISNYAITSTSNVLKSGSVNSWITVTFPASSITNTITLTMVIQGATNDQRGNYTRTALPNKYNANEGSFYFFDPPLPGYSRSKFLLIVEKDRVPLSEEKKINSEKNSVWFLISSSTSSTGTKWQKASDNKMTKNADAYNFSGDTVSNDDIYAVIVLRQKKDDLTLFGVSVPLLTGIIVIVIVGCLCILVIIRRYCSSTHSSTGEYFKITRTARDSHDTDEMPMLRNNNNTNLTGNVASSNSYGTRTS